MASGGTRDSDLHEQRTHLSGILQYPRNCTGLPHSVQTAELSVILLLIFIFLS